MISMEQDTALKLIKDNIKGPFLINHMLATEAIMKRIAEKIGEDKNKWALCGLLHDIDFEDTKDNPINHGPKGIQILKEHNIDEEIQHSILAHNFEHTKILPETKMDFCLLSADAMTGLIIACAMVKEKKLENVTDKTIKKAFKKKGFAAGSNRENIMTCEKLGISFDEFIHESREAMQEISEVLGL